MQRGLVEMSELESLKSIFKDRIFKVPDYQRGYAWTRKQLEDFWQDIVNLPPDKYHYTGLLSLKRVDEANWKNWDEERWMFEDRGSSAFHIVDGQQRISTFVIFINEIVNIVKRLPENKDKKDEDIYIGTFNLKQITEEYLVIQKPPQFIINTYKFGYEIDNPSFIYLRHRILGEQGGGDINETFYTLNLKNAKGFFKENLENHYQKYGISAIEALFKKTTQNLKFNLLEIENDFDVFVAFETMNNRGKKLSTLELLKNRLIFLSTLYSDDELKDDEKSVLRNKINDAWKEVYCQLGRNKKRPLSDDEFLTAHWIMYFRYTRQKADAYIRFLLDEKFTSKNVYSKTEVKVSSVVEVEEMSDDDTDDNASGVETDEIIALHSKLSPKEIKNYVESLKSAAVHWYNTFYPLNNADLTSDESVWLDRLNRIGIAYFRPLVTASFLSPKLKTLDRIKLFKEIERFIFIAFRLGRSYSTYGNSEFYQAARKLLRGELTVDALCQNIKSWVEEWLSPETNFDYKPFQVYLQKLFRSGDGYYDWNGLRYFLYEYELEKVNQLGNKKIDWSFFVKNEKDKVSIEHIYPQTPKNDYWENAFLKASINEKRLLSGSLGNLLPLSSSINSSLQNDSFPDKKTAKFSAHGEKVRRGYADGSHSEIEVADYSEWDSAAILERGLQLLTFMEKRWNIKFPDETRKKELLFLDFL